MDTHTNNPTLDKDTGIGGCERDWMLRSGKAKTPWRRWPRQNVEG